MKSETYQSHLPLTRCSFGEDLVVFQVMNLLLVEDEGDLLDLYTEWLEPRNWSIDRAKDGKQALQLLENQTYDLIITDLAMPENSGADVIMFLRFIEQNQRTRVIVISGALDSDTENKLKTLSVKVQAKPVLKEAFIQLVDSEISKLTS